MKILGIIPSRYGSTRFPAKALADLGGKTIIQRVYEQASKSHRLNEVIVATDHESIYKHVQAIGGQVIFTDPNHQSGTDRCQEVVEKIGDSFDYVINIQGDEPFISPAQLNELAQILDGTIEIATMITSIKNNQQIFDENVVKVIKDHQDMAIYFSRNPIPYLRNVPKTDWVNHHKFYKHLGIYAYRADILAQITRLPVSSLEKSESLEQLRWLEHGYSIRLTPTKIESPGIDTPQDLEEAKKRL